MQYPVPQFQDVEDKVIGPLTFKQFIYLLGGGGLSYVLLRVLPSGLNLLLIAIVMGTSTALAFYKINNQPFINILEAAFYYSIKNKLYLWSNKRPKKDQVTRDDTPKNEASIQLPNLTKSKMKDISWNLDINEEVQKAQEAENSNQYNVLSNI